MSEYQYYEFLALDKPLTDKQRAELRKLSSRAEITATRFVNEYNYGDSRGSPEKLMDRYFDAFLYLANWGTRRLMFRFPRALLDFSSWASSRRPADADIRAGRGRRGRNRRCKATGIRPGSMRRCELLGVAIIILAICPFPADRYRRRRRRAPGSVVWR